MAGCMTKSASAEKSSRRGGRQAQWELTVLNTQNQQEEALLRFRAYVQLVITSKATDRHSGVKNFKGLSYRNFGPRTLIMINKVVVIGSGVLSRWCRPAEKAAKVTMLQRSPTYIVSMPAENAANWARRNLPAKLAYGLTRWRNVLLNRLMFWYCRRFPEQAKNCCSRACAPNCRRFRSNL